MLLSLLASARASLLFGVAWTPPGVGALAWDDADLWSDTLAGEFDGLLRPPLTAHAGWGGPRLALTGNLAAVRLGTTTTADARTHQSTTGLRLGGDARRYLWAREAGRATAYGAVGAYGIVPFAANTSSAFTTEEQADADEGALADRQRIGGFGGQAGFGAEYVVGDREARPTLAIGARWLARMHRAQAGDEVGTTVSTVLLTEAAVTLEIIR